MVRCNQATVPRNHGMVPWIDPSAPSDACLAPSEAEWRAQRPSRGTAQPFHGAVKSLQGTAQPLSGTTELSQHTVESAILTLTLIGNAVLVGWGWQGFRAFLDLLEIQVDRGDGKGWVFLTVDTTPDYTDTCPLPDTPTKWKYRAIYHVGDAQVGMWSNTVEIAVGG